MKAQKGRFENGFMPSDKNFLPPVKSNLTTGVIADKHRKPLPSLLVKAFTDVQHVVDTLNQTANSVYAIPMAFKLVKLADSAESSFKRANASLDEYENSLIDESVGFQKMMSSLSAPKDPTEAIQQSTWQAAMVQAGKGKARTLAMSDPTLARAALQLPQGLANTVGLESRRALKEVVFPGYTEETQRFEKLTSNLSVARQHLKETLQPLYLNGDVDQARKDVNAISQGSGIQQNGGSHVA